MSSTAGLHSAASSTAYGLWGFGYHVVAVSRLHPIYPREGDALVEAGRLDMVTKQLVASADGRFVVVSTPVETRVYVSDGAKLTWVSSLPALAKLGLVAGDVLGADEAGAWYRIALPRA